MPLPLTPRIAAFAVIHTPTADIYMICCHAACMLRHATCAERVTLPVDAAAAAMRAIHAATALMLMPPVSIRRRRAIAAALPRHDEDRCAMALAGRKSVLLRAATMIR